MDQKYNKYIDKFKEKGDRIINIIKKTNEKINMYIPEYKKFNNFVKQSDPNIKNILKTIPNIIISITVFLIKNKRIIDPIIEAYKTSLIDNDVEVSIINKIMKIIKEYVKIINSMPIFSQVVNYTNLLYVFIEHIPEMFNYENKKQLQKDVVVRDIVKNIEQIQEEYINKPNKIKERENRERIEKMELEKQRKQIEFLLNKSNKKDEIEINESNKKGKTEINKSNKKDKTVINESNKKSKTEINESNKKRKKKKEKIEMMDIDEELYVTKKKDDKIVDDEFINLFKSLNIKDK